MAAGSLKELKFARSVRERLHVKLIFAD